MRQKHGSERRVTPPVIGSEIRGIDLNQVDAVMAAKIKTALNERLVLVFRDQSLTREAHKRFARFFGTGQLQRHTLSRSGDPEILDVKTDKDSKFTAGEGWHTGVSCEAAPISASMLYLTRMPEGGGGDTLFANMAEAYKRLSEPVKAFVRTLKAVHDGALPWKTIYGIDPKRSADRYINDFATLGDMSVTQVVRHGPSSSSTTIAAYGTVLANVGSRA